MGINTDYLLVFANILNPRQPMMEEGRYAIPISLLKDKELQMLIEHTRLKYQALLNEMGEHKTVIHNPQTLHKSFKEEIL